MSVKPGDIRFYGSANMQLVDGATQGGAVNTNIKVLFSEIPVSNVMTYFSSSGNDTGANAVVLTVYGRDATGAIQNEAKTLTSTTPVIGTQVFNRLLYATATGTTAQGDVAAVGNTAIVSAHTAQGAAASTGTTPTIVTLQSGDGAAATIGQIIRFTNNSPAGVNNQIRQFIAVTGYGTDNVAVDRDFTTLPTSASTYNIYDGFYFELLPNQITKIQIPFYNASSDVAGGSTKNYYEKIFVINTGTVTALTSANVVIQTDPASGNLGFALETSQGGSTTAANRQTAPGSITAWANGTAPQTIAVQGTGNLAPGTAPNASNSQGIWLNLTLTAGLAPALTSFTIRAIGLTT